MPTDHLTPQPSSNLSKRDLAALDGVIKEFLGLGLAYSQWPAEVRRRGCEWSPELKNIIIKKEWEFFKLEIQLLQSQPEIAKSSRFNSNSLASILKRLKGEPWVEGQPDERDKRLRERRLLGRDAKIRCLQKYVHDWDQEVTVSAPPSSVQIAAAKLIGDKASSFSMVPETGSTYGVHNNWDVHDTTEADARLIPGNMNVETDTMHSVYNYPSQLRSSISPLSTQFDPFPVTTGDIDLVPSSQITALLPDAETSGYYPESERSGNLPKSQLALNQCEAIVPSDESSAKDEDVLMLTNYNPDFDLLELDPNIFTWMDQNLGSDNFELAEIETVSTAEGRPKKVSQSVSPPRKRRKRRCQETTRASFEKPGYGNGTPAAGHLISDGDTMMPSYEGSSQHTNELVSKLSSTQLAPPSGPLPSLPYARVISEPAFTDFRTHIELQQELQQELQRTRKELISIRKKYQKGLETSARELQARDTEISDLNNLVKELQLSNERYFQQIVELTNENIILKDAKSRIKTASSFSTGTKERGHSIKPLQTFPPSKNPRPLSLTHRPAPASKPSSPSQKLSTVNAQDTSIRGVTIVRSSSNKSQASSGQPVPESNPSKPLGQHHHHGSEDSTTGPNSGLSTRRDPIQTFMHKFSNQFLRQPKQFRDDNSRAGPIPLIPPLVVSVPLNRQMAAVLVDGDKRLTKDSGYDSLQFETSSRASMADAD